MKNAKKFFIFLVVLALVSAPAFSLPLLDKISSRFSASDSLEEPVPEEPVEEPISLQEEPVESSETVSEETLTQLSNVLTDLETASRLSKNQLSELIAQLEVIKAQYEVLVADYEAKEAALDEQQRINAEQADALAKELKSKFFANTTLGVSFEDGPLFSVGANAGMRFGKGMLVSVGASLPVYDLKAIEVDFRKTQLNLSLGWEW